MPASRSASRVWSRYGWFSWVSKLPRETLITRMPRLALIRRAASVSWDVTESFGSAGVNTGCRSLARRIELAPEAAIRSAHVPFPVGPDP